MYDESPVGAGFWIAFIVSVVVVITIKGVKPELMNLVTAAIIVGISTSLGMAIGYAVQAQAQHDRTLKELRTYRSFISQFIPIPFRQERIDTDLRELAVKYEEAVKNVHDFIFIRKELEEVPGKKGKGRESREEMRQRHDRHVYILDELVKAALRRFEAAYDLAEEFDGHNLVFGEKHPSSYLPKPEEGAPAA